MNGRKKFKELVGRCMYSKYTYNYEFQHIINAQFDCIFQCNLHKFKAKSGIR